MIAGQGYRPEIEGLRAIAVLAVVLCHAEVPGFSGGFLGVDIFFVISGYLIARNCLAELDAGSFSLAGFYERRARRIGPALLVMMAICAPVAAVLLAYEPLQNFGQSLIATVLFSNNILLTMTSGYWDLDSQFKPLLHTWSLGVEEQFYLLFPLLLLSLGRRRRVFAITVTAILIVSLFGGWWLARDHADAAYYLLPSRAWQLAAGVLVALMRQRRTGWLAFAGLALIATAIGIGREGATPASPEAIAATLGAVLVLACAAGTQAGGMLGAKAMQWIGGLSYSLYLWHQPIFALRRIEATAAPVTSDYVVLLPLVLLFAWASTCWVEPHYRSSARVPFPQFGRTFLALGAALAAVGAALHLGDGFPQSRFGAVSWGLQKGYNERIHIYATAHFSPNMQSRILLIGNSRARDFGNVMIEGGILKTSALVYRENFDPCSQAALGSDIVQDATLIIIESSAWSKACLAHLPILQSHGRRVLVLGPRQFGYSIEPWLRLTLAQKVALRVEPITDQLEWNSELSQSIPRNIYINFYALLSPDGRGLPLFDERGLLVSGDRVHLTRQGAQLFARRLSSDPRLGFLRPAANQKL